jgi:hypothetical protein
MPLVGGISHPAGAAGPAGATGSTGAQGNPGGTIATNGSITSGAAVLTSASNPFTAAMAGCTVVVSGAGASGADLVTTILTFTNAGSVTLAANAGTTKTANAVISVNLAKGATGATGSTGATGPQGTMAGTIAVNGSITSGAAVLTSASNPFTAAMVGCTVSVIGAGAAGGTLVTTIQSFTNAGSVTLVANAGTTVTGTGVIQVNLATGATGPAGPQGVSVATAAPSSNYLVNGGFEIWQRGTSFAAMATNAFGPDRWQFSQGSTSALTCTQESTIAEPGGSQYSAKLVYTHVAASTFFQKLEFFPQLRSRTLSLTIMVYATAGNAVRIRIDDSAGAGVPSSFHPGNSAWAQLTAQKTIASNATSVNIVVELDATATVYVDSAMLVIGSVPSSYIPLMSGDDLARCQRYYEVIGSGVAGEPVGMGFVATTTRADFLIQYSVVKGGAPAIAISAPVDFNVISATFGQDFSTLTPGATGTRFVYLAGVIASASLVVGQSVMMRANTPGRLRIEWNP